MHPTILSVQWVAAATVFDRLGSTREDTDQVSEQQPAQRFEIEIAPEIEPGVHADFATIWHTPHTFVLDFASLRRPPEVVEGEDGGQSVLLPTRIVSRVKIPPEQVFELMKALEQQLSAWEREKTGREPGGPPGSNPGSAG